MIVGLTGGIGSGKTTVAALFSKLGVPVYNSDIEAKKIMHISKEVKQAIVKLLGKESYIDEKLNKKYISDKVFNNKRLLNQLNEIVHPAVKRHFLNWVKQQNAPYVIQETALIFENNTQSNYYKIILVKASKDIRLQRVMDRDGVSKEAVESRIKNQLEDDFKEKLSDYTIEYSHLNKTQSRVEQLHKIILSELK